MMSSKSEETETKQKYSLVLYVSAILVAMFVVWGLFSPSSLQEVASSDLDWMINTFGWFSTLR